MSIAVANELRLLTAADLDARSLLTIVIAGDERLDDKLRARELVPLAGRLRVILRLGALDPADLRMALDHVITQAGHAALMTSELKDTICERAAGNLRLLMNMAAELLDAAVERNAKQLDEQLYLDVFALALTPPRTAKATTPCRSTKRRTRR
jgi:general secretion pathway protein A